MLSRIIDQALDQYARVVDALVSWAAADIAYAADAQYLPAKHPGQVVLVSAGQHVRHFDERIATPMTKPPRGLPEGCIGGRERSATETLV